ncbi:hypothetical protein [Streptomyces yunnanensis]|nr:hypothetical protein [Streptomyces yunnanensis]
MPNPFPMAGQLSDIEEFIAEIDAVTGDCRESLEKNNRFRWRLRNAVEALREAVEMAHQV